MHAVALKLLLQSAEYGTETQEWSKLLEDRKTWLEWKTNFREAYVSKGRTEAAREGEKNRLEALHCLGRHPKKDNTIKNTEGTPQITKQML